MKFSWPVYGALGVVALVSFVVAWFLPTTDIMHGILGSPAIVALIGVVYQIFRDHATYEKTLALQRDQQHFALGVTSHMATVAFDKHVKFCESYISQMQETLATLFREGPTKECLSLASKLADIRLSFRTWLTSDIQDKIMPFEDALQRIGGNHIMLESLPVGDVRAKMVEEMHNTFADVLGLSRLEKRGNNDPTVVAGLIMDHLQDILGVNQLVRLRIKLVDEAVKTLEKKD